MAPLAFVEVLGRHGEVVARHPVLRWPSRIGRGYDMDVVLDDPFVAPGHVEIAEAEDGGFAVSDLGSRNGMYVLPGRAKQTSARVGPDDVVRIGHTQLRIRPRSFSVPAERQIQQAGAFRRPVPFLIAAALLLAVVVWSAFLTTSQEEESAFVAFSVLFVVLAAAVWISVWSLVGRTVGGRANFAAHGFVACAGVLAWEIWDTAIKYLAFGLDTGWLRTAGFAGAAVLFAYVIYRHLRLASRGKSRVLAVTATLASAVAFGGAATLTHLTTSATPGLQPYNEALKAPFFVLVPGISPASFLATGERLKREVDAMAAAAE